MSSPHAFFIVGSYAALTLAVIIELWALRRRRQAALTAAQHARQVADRYGRSLRREEHA